MKDLGKKKLIVITCGIVIVVLLIIIILLVYNAIFGKTSYSDIENKVLTAAKEYYGEHPELLPKNENEQVSTTDSALTQAKYLKSMAELTKDMKGVSCKATVIVSYAGGEYRYTPLLDCGDSYSTKTLSSYIKDNEKTVFTGQGLYELNGELVFRGENPNNFVNFSGRNWRILKIENDKVVLILNEKLVSEVWDDRYNNEKNRTDGINDYNVSRIKDTLNDFYKGDTLFNSKTRNLLAIHNLYVGKRSDSDNYNDGSIEKGQFLEGQYMGLLPLYDYINVSIDENCSSVLTNSCSNYNYLNKFDYNWWTLTGDSSNTYKVFRVANDGTISPMRASSKGYVRPVIYLASDVLYASGDGTEDNPYKIK